MTRAYVGTSGWTNLGLDLEEAAAVFDAVEINGSFYKQIQPAVYQRWYDATPRSFRFALKGHRFVTHYKRLRECEASIVLLRDQAAPLADKLGAVVWQLPAHVERDLQRLESFCASLVTLWPARHALELRHRSWFTDEVASVLARANVAACISDAPDFPMWRAVTADFVYVRLHGHTRKYASSYSERNLRAWAAATRRWLAGGRDVHVYFDNDAEGHAVTNAQRLQALLDPRTRRAVTYSRPAPSGSVRASPSRPPSAPRRSPSSSARRSTARTGSRARPPAARARARDRAGTDRR